MTQTAYPIDASAGSPSYAATIGRHAGAAALSTTNAAGRHVRSGVKRTNGNDLQVSVAGDDVVVQSGFAVVDGPASFQGAYAYVNDATVTLADTIPASHTTLTRIDSVYVRVYDDLYDSSGQRSAEIIYLVGTASGSPTPPPPPAPPAAAMKIADIQVGPVSGGSVITVLDRRRWLTAQGGIVSCQTVADVNRGILDPVTPTLAYEENGGRVKLWNGSSWQTIYDPSFAWVNLSYEAGYTTDPSTGVQAAYREEPGAWVSIRGRVRRTSGLLSASFGPMVILPAAVRPGAIYAVAVASTFDEEHMGARVEIKPTGSVEGWVTTSVPKQWIELAGRWTKAGL